MPTYQYACTACDERVEAVQSFTDAPLTECPACGGSLRKVFSAVGVVFKGSGFYKTDSRSSGKGNGDGKAETKSEGAQADGGTKGTSGSGDKAASSSGSTSSSSSSSAPAAPTPASKSA